MMAAELADITSMLLSAEVPVNVYSSEVFEDWFSARHYVMSDGDEKPSAVALGLVEGPYEIQFWFDKKNRLTGLSVTESFPEKEWKGIAAGG